MGLQNTLAINRLSSAPSIIPRVWNAGGGRKTLLSPSILLAVITLLPAAYSAYVLRQAAARTTATASISPPDPAVLRSTGDGEVEGPETDNVSSAIPSYVLAALELYVIGRERIVSEAVPLKRLLAEFHEEMGNRRARMEEKNEGEVGERGLLETYLGTTMRMFTWTPQAFLMKAMVSRLPGGERHAETFSAEYLDACRFQPGDRVCGVYVVRSRVASDDGERVFLDLSAPEGWKGPVVTGVLDCGYVLGEENGEKVVKFVNETVLWRTKDAKPTLLEGKVSRYLHTAMIGWMMVRGVEAVTRKR
ncbi:hypothetical protein NPX13_g2692 [Xylaria arbuscula]|uniref:Uncharacterized protein n=1 Tax=Xylaria arbuscula TaxID=114810 RepID=A0A9W8NIQ5_9PEZI|nr:hypothetical protein NPX13_g2692 [Xylaria arbuscula]